MGAIALAALQSPDHCLQGVPYDLGHVCTPEETPPKRGKKPALTKSLTLAQAVTNLRICTY
jgi:hypothetical protein